MMENKVFEDGYTRDFNSAQDFFSFLTERKNNSRWTKAPSRDLKFQPVEKDTPMGNVFFQLYDAKGDGELMLDTMENTKLMMSVNGT